jgi:4-amino-4-deoxy-L-arabinose transferase-like glycosyltransferase
MTVEQPTDMSEAASIVTSPASPASRVGKSAISARQQATTHSALVSGALGIGLAVLALATRLPLLADVPRFTDESADMLVTYALAEGQALPLVNASSYVGVLLTYLVAPIYKLFGPRLELARLVVALFGVATLLPTYWLGRRLGGHWAGLAAAALLAASAPHALLSSRVAWSNSITPFFAALAAWLLVRAVQERHGLSLFAAGLAAGLAFQTHFTAIALLPGALIYLLLKGRGLLASRWTVLALAAAVLANGNLIYYNLATGGESFARAGTRWGDYTRGERPVYQRDLLEMLESGGRIIGGAITDRFLEEAPLLQPIPLLLVGLVVASLVWCAARGQILPLLMVVGAALVFPLFVTRYEPVMVNARYLMPLLPICLAAAGAALVGLSRAQLGLHRRVSGLLATLLLLVGVTWHVLAVQRYLASSVDQALTNERYYQAQAVLMAQSPTDDVLVDQLLSGRGTGGGGDLLEHFRYMLETNRRPYRVVERLARPGGTAGQSRVVIVRTSGLSEFGPNVQLTPLLPAVEAPRGANFGIYRVQYPSR